MTKKPIKDLPKNSVETKDEALNSDELEKATGGLLTTGGLTSIGGIASVPTTKLADE